MSMHPADIIHRGLEMSRLRTDQPRRPLRQESPKNLKWMAENFGHRFTEPRATAERVKAEYEASKERVKA